MRRRRPLSILSIALLALSIADVGMSAEHGVGMGHGRSRKWKVGSGKKRQIALDSGPTAVNGVRG